MTDDFGWWSAFDRSNDDLTEEPFESLSGKTYTTTAQVTGINLDSLRIALGIDPAKDERDPTFAAQIKGRIVRPPVAPRKHRGLTGKRYRIARRRYAREMKAWRRGQWGTPVDVHYYFPRVNAINDAVETVLRRKRSPLPHAAIRGHSVQFVILDEGTANEQVLRPGDLSTER